MSTATILDLAIAAALFGFAWLVWGALRPRPSDTAHRDQQHDVGPDSLRLLAELDAHLDAYATQLNGLYDQAPVPADPAWNAGLERLWDAVRDEQRKGDPR